MSSPVTIQPSSKDAYITSEGPTMKAGTDSGMLVAPETAARNHTLVSFDFSPSVPAGATITLATLSLYAYATVSGRTIGCYRLRRTDWVEAEICWSYYKGTTGWGTAGALDTTTDHDTTDGATSASLSSAGWQNWTVTAQVQYAKANVAGIAHFFLRDTGANATGKIQSYCTREYATASLRPKLYIEYTLPQTGGAFLLRMIA